MKSTNDDDYYTSDDVMAEGKSGRNVVNKLLLSVWLGAVMGGGGGRMQFMSGVGVYTAGRCQVHNLKSRWSFVSKRGWYL